MSFQDPLGRNRPPRSAARDQYEDGYVYPSYQESRDPDSGNGTGQHTGGHAPWEDPRQRSILDSGAPLPPWNAQQSPTRRRPQDAAQPPPDPGAARPGRGTGAQRALWEPSVRRPFRQTGAQRALWDTGSQQTLRNSGAQRTIVDSGPQRPLRDSGAQRSAWDTGAHPILGDSGPQRTVVDSGPQRSLRDSGAERTVWDSGAQRSVRDTGAQLTTWDTPAQAGQPLPRRTSGPFTAVPDDVYDLPPLDGAPRRERGRGLLAGAVAGFLAAAVALGVANLMAAFVRPQASPIIAVGGAFIDRTPPALKNFAVEKFGENDKTMLLLGMYVTIALIAIVIGMLAWRRLPIGVAGIGLFGLFGAFVAITRPDSHVTDIIPSIAGGIAGIAAMVYLVRAGLPGSRTSGSRTSGSRTSGSRTSGSRTSGSRASGVGQPGIRTSPSRTIGTRRRAPRHGQA